MRYTTERTFHETFFDDAIISPADRRILLFEVRILDRIGPEGDLIRSDLDSFTLPGIVELLERHGFDLQIVPKKKK